MDANPTINGYAAAIDKLTRLNSVVLAAMHDGLRNGLESAAEMSQREYLSGPRPVTLDVITGRLRQSIASQVEVVVDSQVVGMIGSDVRYAAFHEYGFHGIEQVRTFTRATKSGAYNGRGQKKESAVNVVRAHSRQVNYAGRPFLKPALDRCLPAILQDIKDEIGKAIRGK